MILKNPDPKQNLFKKKNQIILKLKNMKFVLDCDIFQLNMKLYGIRFFFNRDRFEIKS